MIFSPENIHLVEKIEVVLRGKFCYTISVLIQILFANPFLFLTIAAAVLLALSVHEYFHAWTAYSLGDPTAKNAGRLTVNPLAHLDPIGTFLIFIVGIGWGKPVPINPANFKNQKRGELLVGLSGPASNFLMALAAGLFIRFFEISNPGFFIFLSFFVWINLVLSLINVLPIPPLDGSHMLFALPLPESAKFFLAKNSLLFLISLFLIIWFVGFSFILRPIYELIAGMPSPF